MRKVSSWRTKESNNEQSSKDDEQLGVWQRGRVFAREGTFKQPKLSKQTCTSPEGVSSSTVVVVLFSSI